MEHEDFIPTQGVLTFGPEETSKFIEIGIVDNDEYEEDEQFFVSWEMSQIELKYLNLGKIDKFGRFLFQ